MVDKLSEGQIQEFKLVFSMFDRNRDGYIEKDDIAHIVRLLHLEYSEEQLSDMLAEVDADGSGSVDFIEFLNMMARKIVGLKPHEQIKDAFDLLDSSGHGTVPLQTLHSMLRSFGEDVTEDELLLLFQTAKAQGAPAGAAPPATVSASAAQVDLATFIRMCDPALWDL